MPSRQRLWSRLLRWQVSSSLRNPFSQDTIAAVVLPVEVLSLESTAVGPPVLFVTAATIIAVTMMESNAVKKASWERETSLSQEFMKVGDML